MRRGHPTPEHGVIGGMLCGHKALDGAAGNGGFVHAKQQLRAGANTHSVATHTVSPVVRATTLAV